MTMIDNLSGRVVGEFVLRNRLDEGGFGSVYRAEQPALGREVVVKVLHQRLRGAADLQRFGREAQLAALLDHPYAAHVHAAGIEPDGLVWIAMELVRGRTLGTWIKECGRIPLEQLVPFFERVAEVVQAAHERGIVHRDLKPSNVMVIERAGRLSPKLLDLGVAKLVDELEPATAREPAHAASAGETTSASALIGSPPYMAPEQWNDAREVGPAADLYALGVIAYEALTGARPYRAETIVGLSFLHRAHPVPAIGSPGLDRIFARAMAKRPADRYASALDLAAALRGELEARLVGAVRTAARQWHDRGRPRGLLWRDEALAELEQWVERTGARALTEAVDLEFVEACRRAGAAAEETARRRAAWARRGGIALGTALVALVVGVVQYRAATEVRVAQRIAEATAIAAEVEQGRAALLHDDLPEAQQHLTEAWRRGDDSRGTRFMLQRATQPLHAELARFAASSGRMWSAAWSPDGTRILTSDDHAAQIWDVAARQLVATMGHDGTVHDARFTPDGERVVTAGGDGVVRIWRAADGADVRELAAAGGAKPRYFALAVTGRLVAAADAMGAVTYVWDAATGVQLAELAGSGSGWPVVAFSADGRWLAAGAGDQVRVYDTATWAIATTLRGPRIRAIAWDPAGSRLLTGSAEGDASIWEVPSGARARHLREIGEVGAVAWAPNGSLVAVVGRDGAEQVFEAATGKLAAQGNQLHGAVLAVEFDASSRLIAAGGSGNVAISDAATGMPVAMLGGPRGVVRTAHFDPSSTRVLGASWDGTARIWSARSPYRQFASTPIGDDCGVATSMVPDGRYVAIACRGRASRVWDTARDQLLAELPPATAAGPGVDAPLPAVSALGDRAAVARGAAVEVYELPGGRLLRRIEHGAAVSAVAIGAGGAVVSGDLEGRVLVTRGDASVVLPAARGAVEAVAILDDGRLVAADAAGRLRVIAGDRVVAELEAPTRVGQLRPSSDGRRLVTIPVAAIPAAPALWDLQGYRMVGQLEGHVGRVFSARWVAGERILTSGGDGSVRMWDSTGVVLAVYRGGSRRIGDAALSPDGAIVVGGDADGILRFWDAASARPLWTTPAHKAAVVGLHYDRSDLVSRDFTGSISRWRIP